MIKKFKKIIIATGGTGGHIFPAVSLANHFLEQKINVEIVSDRRGLRYLENFRGLKITEINSSTIFSKNFINKLFSLFNIFFAFLRSLFFLIIKRPKLVFGMGGYASFPICLASILLGVPFIIYENNLFIGKANRYLLPFAKKIFVSYGELEGISEKYKNKMCVIGNIIRKEILNYEASRNIHKEEKKLKILILGGSQAAKIFAEKLPDVFKRCKESNMSFEVFQQCLPEQNDFLTSYYQKLKIKFEIFNFTTDILKYFAKSNLVITRSGSSMLAELVNVKIPFISVPLPTSAENHQLKNAIYYSEKEYSYLVEERDLNANLFALIKKLSENMSLLDKIIHKQRQYSDKSVYKNIEEQINQLI